MSYTTSNAQLGLATTFAVDTSAAPHTSPTYESVSEILDFSQTGTANKFVPVTNLMSTAEEVLATLPSPGSYDLSFNRVASDAGQAGLKAAFISKLLTNFKITLVKNASQTTTGDTIVFTAFVEEFDDTSAVSPEKQIVTKCKIKVSGTLPTLTIGS